MADSTQPIIKICGLRDATQVRVAALAGATAAGFMLAAESRRKVTAEEARELGRHAVCSGVWRVGVTVNETASMLNLLREEAHLDILQLSGDEEPSILDELDGNVWKAMRFEPGTAMTDAARMIDPWFDRAHPIDVLLVDAYVKGVYGGSGHRADWDLASKLSERYPVVLAGGLSPDNVGEAVEAAGPMGVDVSSGVESDGRKDPAKIEQFVTGARAAFGLAPATPGVVR